MPELIIVPRWGGTPSSDCYPWLVARARDELGVATRFAELAPSPGVPEPGPTAAAVATAIAAAHEPIVLAHSVGCRAALMAAASLGGDRTLPALICLAGWFTVDAPWPSIVPWLDPALFDLERARAHVRELVAVISDDDPFTADHAATRASFERLGARVTLVPGGRHFNRPEEPAAWDAVAAAVTATRTAR
jgi:predicted alpha/beta hydrolase family esterase